MGEVHQLILREGLEGARSKAESRADRQAVEAAAAVMAEEVSRFGITHARFAMTSLPHKRIEEPLWRRQGHRTTLLVESGRAGNGGWIGVPYGSMARLILLYLQTEAIRTNSPEVELGRSMHAWLSRMDIPTGGKNYKLVSEQARRISACRLPPDLPDRDPWCRAAPERRLRAERDHPHGRGRRTPAGTVAGPRPAR
jgi:Plasmid encoded RepA protein